MPMEAEMLLMLTETRTRVTEGYIEIYNHLVAEGGAAGEICIDLLYRERALILHELEMRIAVLMPMPEKW